jgi:diguanylate cyclase (GGDEF)-like protein
MTQDRAAGSLLRAGTYDSPQISRTLGVLLLCGAGLTTLQISLNTSERPDAAGLYGIAVIAFVLGAASIIWARRALPWTVHVVFVSGTALICLGIVFAGVATGAYSVLFVWLVITAASFFSPRAIAAHVLWILLGSAAALALVDTSPGVSPLTRWAFGSLLLVIAASVMTRVAAGRRAIEELKHLANHDPLTGLANRRRLDDELARELARAARNELALCVLALDIDGFKAYNDRHGHIAGDRLLKRSASVWVEALRSVDMVARIGGDEFVVLLPDCALADARRVAERLCEGIPFGPSCSAGAALWDGRESAEALLDRADREMYQAKKSGTPRTILAATAAAKPA